MFPDEVGSGGGVVRVLDPMCGVGSYLCSMARVAVALGCRLEIRGGDQEETSAQRGHCRRQSDSTD
ncbi:hypothetical protein T484DRAFT_1841549 [Baffinella frigidus]|nr:hypothetical protein T484DRAFT_1841549 [Cryptophyta sp. CCMP2293]